MASGHQRGHSSGVGRSTIDSDDMYAEEFSEFGGHSELGKSVHISDGVELNSVPAGAAYDGELNPLRRLSAKPNGGNVSGDNDSDAQAKASGKEAVSRWQQAANVVVEDRRMKGEEKQERKLNEIAHFQEVKAAICVVMLVSEVGFEAVYFQLPLAALAKGGILLFSMLFQSSLVYIVGQQVVCGCTNLLFISYDKDYKKKRDFYKQNGTALEPRRTGRQSNLGNAHHRRMLGSKHEIYSKSSVNLFTAATESVAESARASVGSVSSMVSTRQWNMERLWGLRLRLESTPYEGVQAVVTIVQSSLFFYYMQFSHELKFTKFSVGLTGAYYVCKHICILDHLMSSALKFSQARAHDFGVVPVLDDRYDAAKFTDFILQFVTWLAEGLTFLTHGNTVVWQMFLISGALRMVRLYRFLHMYYISYIDPTQTRRNDATILHGLLVAKVLLVILVSAALIYCAEYNPVYVKKTIRGETFESMYSENCKDTDDDDGSCTPGWSYWQSIYFVLCTLSTVGYGDFSPNSEWSQVCCVSIIIFGVSVFPGMVADVYDSYENEDADYDDDEEGGYEEGYDDDLLGDLPAKRVEERGSERPGSKRVSKSPKKAKRTTNSAGAGKGGASNPNRHSGDKGNGQQKHGRRLSLMGAVVDHAVAHQRSLQEKDHERDSTHLQVVGEGEGEGEGEEGVGMGHEGGDVGGLVDLDGSEGSGMRGRQGEKVKTTGLGGAHGPHEHGRGMVMGLRAVPDYTKHSIDNMSKRIATMEKRTNENRDAFAVVTEKVNRLEWALGEVSASASSTDAKLDRVLELLQQTHQAN